MATIVRKCRLTFEGGCENEPCLWRMSRRFPEVEFDIRQANVGEQIGIMAVKFEGDEADVQAAIEFLVSLGVRVDPAEGGSLAAE